MKIVAVDLAAKYSAAVTLTDRGTGAYTVLGGFDSWGRTEDEWIAAVTHPWIGDEPPDVLVVEDLPHGVPFMTNTKQVCRLQGRIIDRLACLRRIDHLRFVAPAFWRRHFTLKNGSGVDAVVRAAEAAGYTAPDLSERIARAGDRTIARKVATDYSAAFLLGTWFLDAYNADKSLDFPGSSSPFEVVAPRRSRRPQGPSTRKVKAVATQD